MKYSPGRLSCPKITSPIRPWSLSSGAGGDLTWRKLVPALYHLEREKWLDERFAVLGIDRKEISDEEFRATLLRGAQKASRTGSMAQNEWEHFGTHIHRLKGDLADPTIYQDIKKFCDARAAEWKNSCPARFFTSPCRRQ